MLPEKRTAASKEPRREAARGGRDRSIAKGRMAQRLRITMLIENLPQGAGAVAKLVICLPGIHRALSSILSTTETRCDCAHLYSKHWIWRGRRVRSS